ncbi:hypothetical protein J2R88_007781 [Bradyrhizobium japonicum]|nr:hypothetical protein [Bradyrhizobium japonicum]MCP1788558.1 hypothetical protein [Bradyrhizobium japonicum]MCP1810433.1 hypothetical protein [Bradyrhizobium japonicum]MCP1819367.1 hypothetical protein [Bradyrhizobium japonicum]MCS3906604.1 hypothetical protein [Bradyrhizobium japonicum]
MRCNMNRYKSQYNKNIVLGAILPPSHEQSRCSKLFALDFDPITAGAAPTPSQ